MQAALAPGILPITINSRTPKRSEPEVSHLTLSWHSLDTLLTLPVPGSRYSTRYLTLSLTKALAMQPSPGGSSMGARAASCPFEMCSGCSTSQMSVSTGMLELLRSMPSQYALSTQQPERVQHVLLFHELRQEPPGAQSVHISWAADGNATFSLWLVFPDRRGSLGVITSVISELGVNIAKASAFSTADGIAVDSFTVDRCGAPSMPTSSMRAMARAPADGHRTSAAAFWTHPPPRAPVA